MRKSLAKDSRFCNKNFNSKLNKISQNALILSLKQKEVMLNQMLNGRSIWGR